MLQGSHIKDKVLLSLVCCVCLTVTSFGYQCSDLCQQFAVFCSKLAAACISGTKLLMQPVPLSFACGKIICQGAALELRILYVLDSLAILRTILFSVLLGCVCKGRDLHINRHFLADAAIMQYTFAVQC